MILSFKNILSTLPDLPEFFATSLHEYKLFNDKADEEKCNLKSTAPRPSKIPFTCFGILNNVESDLYLIVSYESAKTIQSMLNAVVGYV